MVGNFPGCCANAESGHAAALPSPAISERRVLPATGIRFGSPRGTTLAHAGVRASSAAFYFLLMSAVQSDTTYDHGYLNFDIRWYDLRLGPRRRFFWPPRTAVLHG